MIEGRSRLSDAADGVQSEMGEEPTTPIERVVVAVRVVVVLSVAALLVVGPDLVRHYLSLAIAVVFVAAIYACAVFVNPGWELRRTRSAWLITGLDSGFTLLFIASTGAGSSPTVTILVLVVVAAAIRLPLLSTIGLASVVSGVYAGIALLVDPHTAPLADRVLDSVWWSVYLMLTAVLGSSLSLLAEREHEARIAARVDAVAEHKAAEEERDLRARLLKSYQAQRDGLQVMLHEFRTPVASLSALTNDLADGHSHISDADGERRAQLVTDHIAHLSEMLNALGDVAASRNPSFSAGHVRNVDLRTVLSAAGDAAGLQPTQLQLSVRPDTEKIRIDGQRLRRILTNLLENAARHGQGHPVEVQAWIDDGLLHAEVLDRGPGVAPEQLAALMGKYVATGERRGHSGLGLWIVEQILQAMGGRLELGRRAGGGFVARFEVPLD